MPDATVMEPSFPYKMAGNIFGRHDQNKPAANVIANQRFKLAYVPIPKNACTAIKLLMFHLQTGREFEGHFDSIHGKFDYKVSDFAKFAADRQYFKFAVIRDPIERFVSAFNSRVQFYHELSEGWFQRNGYAPEQIRASFADRRLSFNPNINEFVHRMDEYINVSTRIQHHFVPQHYFLEGDPQAFDEIYTIRQLDRLTDDLGERVGQPLSLRNVQETTGLDDMAKVTDLGSRERERLLAYYKEDYRILTPYL